MHDIRRIDVQEGIPDENDHIAEHVREHMTEHGILVVNEMGAPGVGKTTTIKSILRHLKSKPYVIEGDIESDIDTKDLKALGVVTFQINTHGACHLDAPLIEHQVSHMDLDGPGVLFIENIGNLVCPAEFTIGEHVMMLISTVTEGSDKPYKYPLAFEKADIIVLNKVDLIPYLDFDEDFYMKGIRALNKDVPVFKVSGRTGEGFEEVAAWLDERVGELGAKAAGCDHHHEHHGDHQHERRGEHQHEHRGEHNDTALESTGEHDGGHSHDDSIHHQ